MTFLESIFQGILQGLTEFLPISSSGHLSLFQHFTGQSGETGLLFSIILHFGTLIAVFIAFYKTIFALIIEFFRLLKDLFTGKILKTSPTPERKMIYLLILSLVPLLFFVLFSDFYKSLSTDNSIFAEGICFIITSMLLFIADRCVKGHKTAKDMRAIDAVMVGIAQGVAPLPGVSRSGSTVSVGMMMGLDKQYAVTFSFIMGMPAVFAANVLEVGSALRENVAFNMPVVLTGFVISIIFGLIAIKMVEWIVKTDKFKYFAYYTLIIGIITILIALFEGYTGQTITQFINL